MSHGPLDATQVLVVSPTITLGHQKTRKRRILAYRHRIKQDVRWCGVFVKAFLKSSVTQHHCGCFQWSMNNLADLIFVYAPRRSLLRGFGCSKTSRPPRELDATGSVHGFCGARAQIDTQVYAFSYSGFVVGSTAHTATRNAKAEVLPPTPMPSIMPICRRV